MSPARGVEGSIEKGADERVEAPCLAHADLGLKGAGYKERMIAQLDRLYPGVRCARPDRHTVPGEERNRVVREPVAARVNARERLVPADVRQARPRNRRDPMTFWPQTCAGLR
jgi:hypothetical protein